MKLRITDRILAAVAGLLLLALCGGMVAQLFFQVDLTGLAGQLFSSEYPQTRWALIAVAACLFLLGAYCILVLFRHRKRKDRFILQKNGSGDLAISIKALENMVQKCIDQHHEIEVDHLYLENKKDGLLIRIRGSVAGGISIPLTVEAVQKQIRQYVTACSGVEIKGIRVQIDSSGEDVTDAPFLVTAPAPKPLLKEPEEKSSPIPPEENIEPHPSAQPAAEASHEDFRPAQQGTSAFQQLSPEDDDEDDRPLHQRLFSSQPEPCIVPEPPAAAGELNTDAAAAEDPAEVMQEVPDSEASEAESLKETAVSPSAPEDAVSEPVGETVSSGAEMSTSESSVKAQPHAEETDGTEGFPAEENMDPAATESLPDSGDAIPDAESRRPSAQADADFMESLRAFDSVVTGKKEEEA